MTDRLHRCTRATLHLIGYSDYDTPTPIHVRVTPAEERGGPEGKFDAQIEGLFGSTDVWSLPEDFSSVAAAIEMARELAFVNDVTDLVPNPFVNDVAGAVS